MSPVLRSVYDAGIEALERRSKPWTLRSADWFPNVEAVRARAARLINADADSMALVPSTSYGLAAVARNVSAKQGDRVLVLGGEFPSNYYTWRAFTDRTG